MTVGDTIQSKNGAGLGGVVTSVNGETGPVDVTASSGVASVDGQTGVVVLSGTYLALAGGTLTGLLTATKGILVSPATSSSIGFAVVGLAGQTGNLTSWLDSSLATLASVNAAGVIAGAGFIVGSNASSTGGVRMPSLSAVNWRNAANNADIGGISTNASDQLQLGTTTVPDADNTKSLGASAKRWATVVTVALITGGTSPAVSGAVRLNNNTGMVGRNAANNADVAIIGINASDKAEVGTDLVGSSDALRTLGSSAVRWAGLHLANFVAVGTNPSSSGAVRLANNSGIASRNAANNADVSLLALNASDVATVGAPLTSTGEIIGTRFAPSTATGATAAARYFRATASGAPASGTWVTGDVVPAQDGTFWHCTAGGTPGTWVQSGSATYQTLANIDTDSAMAANSDTKYASQKATKTALAAKAPTASPTFTGTVTVPDATANTAAAALRQAMFAEVAVPLVSTYYVRSPAQLGTTTGTPTLNLMTCVPIVFTNAGTLVSIAAANNANTATAVCRLGLYADNGSGQPGALIDDYGTVDFSTGPSTKTIVISRAVTAMTLYWLAAVEQGAATSAKVASNGSGSGLTPGYTTPLNSTIPTQCWTQASVSAGLPNPAVVTATGTSSIIVEVKI